MELRGIIDRLELVEDDELVVTDYKTGAVPGERHELQRLAGVHMYALMVEQMLGKRPVRVQLLYLSKPEAIITVPSEQSVTGVARKTQALWSAIQSSCARDDFRPGPVRCATTAAIRPTARRSAAIRRWPPSSWGRAP